MKKKDKESFSQEELEALVKERTRELEKANKNLSDAYKSLKSVQSQLIHQEKMASIGQLAAGIAHELNNPLGYISGNFTALEKYTTFLVEYIEFFEKNLPDSTVNNDFEKLKRSLSAFKQEKKLEFIISDLPDLFKESKEGVTRAVNIVQNLRAFSHVDTLNQIINYNLNKGIEDTLLVAKNEYKYHASIELDFAEDLPYLKINGGEVNQVLLNIIVNASQAFDKNKDIAENIIRISTYKTNKFLICEIKDNGPGIPKNIQNKIFDPFFTTKEVGKGTGLGLSISYDIIVNKNKGQLLLDSNIGEGATFIIKLPYKKC